MASNHVPSDQVPLQGQSIYTDPSYSNFFPNNVERYGTPSWEAQLHQNAALTPNTTNQNWHGTYPQQTFSAQQYGGQPQAFQPASPYQYGQFNQHSSPGTFGAVDPALSLNPSGLRQQQQPPYQMPARNGTPSNQTSTVRGSTTCESGPSVSIDSGFFVRLASDSFTHRAMRQSFDDATRICERIPLHTLDRANPITTINPLA